MKKNKNNASEKPKQESIVSQVEATSFDPAFLDDGIPGEGSASGFLDLPPDEVIFSPLKNDEERPKSLSKLKDLGQVLLSIGLKERSEDIPFFDDPPELDPEQEARPGMVFPGNFPVSNKTELELEMEAIAALQAKIKATFGGSS